MSKANELSQNLRSLPSGPFYPETSAWDLVGRPLTV